MNVRPVLLAAALVSLAAVTARADGIPADGRIIVGHGSDPAPPETCGLDFKIHLNGKGGGIKNCVNTSGVDWIGLEIFATIPLGDTVECITSLDSSVAVFGHCSPIKILSTFDHKENIEIILSGGEITTKSPGQPPCTTIPAPPSCFFINLNTSGSSDPNASGGWFALLGGNIEVHAISAPEPGTILLFLSGLGALCLRRRRSLET